MTPVAESIAKYFRDQGQNKFSEWFHRLSQVLSVSPEESLENSIAPPIPPLLPEEGLQAEVESKIEGRSPREPMEPKTFSQIPSQEISLFSPGKVEPEIKRPSEGIPDSNILSTLTGWLSQLKESKA